MSLRGRHGFVLVVVCVLVLATAILGCSKQKPAGAGYEAKMAKVTSEVEALHSRYTVLMGEYGDAIQKLISSNADTAQIVAVATQQYEQKVPELRSIDTKLASFKGQLSELEPEQGFVTAHNLYLDALGSLIASVETSLNGMALMRDPNTFQDGMAQLSTSLTEDGDSANAFTGAKQEYDAAVQAKQQLQQNVAK